MKPEDKITVEITLGELAKVMLLEGRCNGSLGEDLYNKARSVFGIDWYDSSVDTFAAKIGLVDTVDFYNNHAELLNIFFNRETEQQKQISELKETIQKAQKQIEELEGVM